MGYKCLYQKRRIQKYYCSFFSGYRDRKLISYGDRGIEALPPESEGP